MFSNPVHRTVMDMLDGYFDHPMMQKLKDETGTDSSVYGCRIQSLLLNENRYIVVVVRKDDHPVGHVAPLTDLQWTCFQCRILQSDEFMMLVRHSYIIKRELNRMSVHRVRVENAFSVYRCDTLPLQITLLHTMNDKFEYPDSGTLASCLETFQTILEFTTDG